MVQIIYDGECPVCNGLKEFTEGQTPAGKLDFIPFQAGDLPAGLTVERASLSLYVILENGEPIRGARAIFQIMRQMPGLWGLAGRLLSWPPCAWLTEPFYRLFARHRHRISAWLKNLSEN